MANDNHLPHLSIEIALEQLQANMPIMVEYQQLVAKQMRARYVALITEGFTEAQAIELCKNTV